MFPFCQPSTWNTRLHRPVARRPDDGRVLRQQSLLWLIVDKLREGEDAEAAKFAGALAHVLEDLSQPQCHPLEGINGMPWTVLDELFTPEDQSWNRAPQSIISLDDDPRSVVRIDGYRPQLLGMHPKEVAFHLYARCCRFSYEIPADVFQEFWCTAGLHSQLGLHPSGANLRLTVRFGGQDVFDSGVLEAGSPAQQVVIPVAAGGTLEFVSEGHPRPAGNEANHAVWGEPVLIRLDSAEAPAAAPVKPPSARTS